VRATNLIVKGYRLKVYKRKIQIYDPEGDIEDNMAIVLVQYLFDEGFIVAEDIECEIICE